MLTFTATSHHKFGSRLLAPRTPCEGMDAGFLPTRLQPGSQPDGTGLRGRGLLQDPQPNV